MARGDQVSRRRRSRNKAKLEKTGSDGSDEDYMLSEDEFTYSEGEYCSSLANEEAEESLGEFDEEEDEWVKKNIKKVGTLNYEVDIPRKKKTPYEDSDDLSGANRRKRLKLSRKEKEDVDTENPDEEESDEEFTPDEFDGADGDEEEELNLMKKVCLRVPQVANGRKRKRITKVVRKRNKRKKLTKGRSSRKTRGKRRVTRKGRRAKSNADSDPDFVDSGFSNYEYTISEEEREQIREAGLFCRQFRTNVPSSSSLKMNVEEEILRPQRNQQERKGKEKVVEMKIELGKQLQVCGVCLSEEGKRTVRGILNCCNHYFCFACIMEWSKVESRCPLCKSRFATISRVGRADGKRDLKDVVVPIPERDQVYQPSEEELVGHLYQYENVLCSECHQGGDDALMLLCDLCDSPSHTFCVGLGREVPEESWYCDACSPSAALTSPDHVARNSLSIGDSSSNVQENFDLNEIYVPPSPLSQQAYALIEMGRIRSNILQLLGDMQSVENDSVGPTVSRVSPFSSLISRERAIEHQQDVPPVQMETPQSVIYDQGRLPDHTTGSLLRGRDGVDADLSSLGGFSGCELSEIFSHQQVVHPCNSSRTNTGPESPDTKEFVKSAVKRHLKRLSRNMDIGYNNFKCIARTSTHTILAAFGLEHRRNEVFPIQARPFQCGHFAGTFGSEPANGFPVNGQCSPCFDWFVNNVVKEILYTRAPPLPSAG